MRRTCQVAGCSAAGIIMGDIILRVRHVLASSLSDKIGSLPVGAEFHKALADRGGHLAPAVLTITFCLTTPASVLVSPHVRLKNKHLAIQEEA